MSAISPFIAVLTVLLSVLSAGCGVLFGNVKPVTEKSTSVVSARFPVEASEWKRLELQSIASDEKETAQNAAPDLAYQSSRTSSVISLNSSCRPSVKDETNLEVFTHEPFLGVTGISFREQKETRVSGEPAIETTIQGILEGEETRMRSVVVRKDMCLYDLLLVARPRHFPDDEGIFGKFVSSLRLR